MDNWTWMERDARLAEDLRRRLPRRLFDAHAHLWHQADFEQPATGIWTGGGAEATPDVWRAHLARQVGAERLAGALFIPAPFPRPSSITAVNAWILAAAAACPGSRALALVAPEMSPDDLKPLCEAPAFAGLKPYHTFSPVQPTFQAPLQAFLPEWAWALAHARGLVITLHLVRDGALADPDNQRELRACCERYPHARLILAHAARGFHAPNTVNGIAALRGLDNVWFDSSGICEREALEAILREFGPRRLLWGSDFPVSEIRGRCVTVGDGFAWLDPGSVQWEKTGPQGRPTLVGLESLRALLDAADALGLGAADLQDIFAGNAERLLGLAPADDGRTQALYRHARTRIPGGTQLLSKRPEMLAPDQWPAYFREARGCETWDLDGRHYYDFSTNGIGSCLLGFRDPDVTRAVTRRLNLGAMSSLNPPEEVELADRLCEIHPWAEQVRFARCGGEACAVAVRIARATTDRSVVAICGYHGWQDWYLAANLGASDALRGHLLPGLDPLGVPGELRGTTVAFPSEDRAAFQALIDRHGDRLAAVIMEPCRSHDPEPGWLAWIRDETHRVGALLIFDEITIGWRLVHGGAHLNYDVNPDLAVFAKALGNGHPMAAVIGTPAAMAGAQASFISSTYWTESIGPAAALATLRKLRLRDTAAHVAAAGASVQRTWREAAGRAGLPVKVDGFPCLGHFAFDHPRGDVLRTLFTQQMLGRGFLAGTGFYPTLAHTEEILKRYAAAVEDVFGEIAAILRAGDEPARHLRGPVAHSGFRRLTS